MNVIHIIPINLNERQKRESWGALTRCDSEADDNLARQKWETFISSSVLVTEFPPKLNRDVVTWCRLMHASLLSSAYWYFLVIERFGGSGVLFRKFCKIERPDLSLNTECSLSLTYLQILLLNNHDIKIYMQYINIYHLVLKCCHVKDHFVILLYWQWIELSFCPVMGCLSVIF